ncbi:MAG: hypothetical protein A2X78_00625 [Gammaproteobacteria bacterium GWE2_37_16]|nr:MAG: hypothetical protein A2X78_00625 [Gammaproteobacteria bacterium GWE2_37_16]
MLALTKTPFINAVKSTLNMSVPIMVARLSGALSAVISMLMIAQLGHAELAASALINSMISVFMVTIWSMLFSVGVLVGHNYGAENDAEIGAVFRQSIILGALVSLPIMLILWNIAPILLLCKQDHKLVALTREFFRSYIFAIIPSMIYCSLYQVTLGISKQKVATIYNIAFLIAITIFGYIFLFGKLGFSPLGVCGMGYANTCAFVFIDIIFFGHLFYFKEYRRYKLFCIAKTKSFNFQYLRQLFSIGWPVSAMIAVELGAFSISTIFVGWLGETSLAAQQITLQINLIAFMVPFGIAQASTILISQAIGRRDHGVIRNLGYAALLLGLICTLFFTLLYWLIPKFLISFYLDIKAVENQATLAVSISLLAVTSLMNIFDGVRTIATCALRGLRDTLTPMFYSIVISCCLSLPISYLLAFYWHFGVLGIRWGFVLCFGLSAIILIMRFHKMTGARIAGYREF